MRPRRLAEPSATRVAGLRMTPVGGRRIKLDLYGQDGRRVGRPVKVAAREAARIWCATEKLSGHDDAWLALPRIWREATEGRKGPAVADAFVAAVTEALAEA